MQTITTAVKTKKQYRGVTRWGRIARNLGMILPVIIILGLVVIAIFANFLAPYAYDKIDMRARFAPPVWMEGGSSAHLLGTDALGRDVLSRMIWGGRVSLSVSLLVIFITAAIGTLMGITAGYLGGRIDSLLMRIVDIAMSFPGLLLAMLLSVGIGPGF